MRSIIGKTTATIVTASALVFGLSACTNNGGTSEETKEKISSAVTSTPETGPGEALRTSVQETASSVVSGIGGAWDQAKLTAFTATFRTVYPNLSSDRSDESIESIVKETCTAIDSGANDQEQVAKVTQVATNDGTVPTQDQANRILQLVKPACP
ncbi:hypothetical protein M2284_000292 [Rhodococcus sp. LBL1]|uniref:Lipoprotein n=1 Tax=Prescottella agglutinans TaxID=1644129 RepID=A0ABT6MGS4_9NOCA|nr:hypothetical protein [Prescottella agglutinans]MDH6283531.1 hypothetical protein [Prescottella agglutinans]MDH6676104.1 hypothetical protein [Rhodococcus sp. LBL1]MDH6681390.1 hypothetical protein [Rhodococcus sp. LBL2]